MKKAIFVTIALVFASSLCFAAQSSATTGQSASKQTAAKTTEVKSMTGKVDSVVLENQAKGIKPEIVILGKKEIKHKFLVVASTTIFDKEGKAITLDQITKGKEVQVKYIRTQEGKKDATSISLL